MQSVEKQLVVTVEQVSLRAEPSEKSREIASLQLHETLADLDEVGQNEAQVTLGGHLYQTPWIKVQNSSRQKGWVLAAAVRPLNMEKDWLLQKRLACYFGQAFAARRNNVLHTLSSLENEGQMSVLWHETATLRDALVEALSRRPETDFQLQFGWLNDALPGYLLQKIGAGNRPYLFADIKFWHQNALKTNGLQDDLFFQACLFAFPLDSIESFCPVWKFQLSDSESASQLGMGRHLGMLRQIDLATNAGLLFQRELAAFKELVLEDLFGKDIVYWQPQNRILEEMGQILANPPKCLNAREREALAIRKKMFENPVRNGIKVDLRSGSG